MEVAVLEATGMPPKAQLAVSVGPVRRQVDLNAGQKLWIPAKVSSGAAGDGDKIDVSVFKSLGSTMLPSDLPGEGVFDVPFTGVDGKLSQVKLRARRAKENGTAGGGDLSKQLAMSTEGWLGHQDIQDMVQRLFNEVLRDRPKNPYEFMAERLRARRDACNSEPEPPTAQNVARTADALFEARTSSAEIRPDKDAFGALACEAIMHASQLDGEMRAGTSPKAQALSAPPSLDPKQLGKIHSVIRWNKADTEVEAVAKEVGTSMSVAVLAADQKNGNLCLHIAAQNGHMGLTEFLLDRKADVNAQNNKGQTALHMSIEYDFFFQSKMLLGRGADPKRTNEDGHEALLGIDGGKTGSEAWDNPVTILKAANDVKEELEFAFNALEQADSSSIDKAVLVQTGMAKKKLCKLNWDAERFKSITKKV